MVISSIYWTLLTVASQLILRGEPSSEPTSSVGSSKLVRIPLSLDLSLHAIPCIAMLIEFYLFEEKYSARAVRVHAPVVASVFAVCYGVWVEYCASFNRGCKSIHVLANKCSDTMVSKVPYPFLEAPLLVRLLIYAATTGIAVVSFRALDSLHV